MKKLKLFISLWFTMFSVAVFAQAEFEKIAITQNTLDNSAGRLIVQDATTGELKYILKSVLDNKFNQPTGNATQYLDGAGTPTAFPVLGQADRVITEVRNTTGATVVKGTVIYLSGASGGKATIQKAQANAESTSSGTFGVIQSDINNNSNGYAVVIGTVLGVNTSSYTEGQVLWLSPTVAGGFTSTKPVAPNHAVYVAIVTLAATNGTIEVKVQNGYEIDELHDVLITSKTNNDAIVYDSASGLWKNKQLVADAITDGTTTVAPSQNAVFDALAAKENTSSKNVANGYAGLGSDGKLFSTQLPSITITDTFVVGSQAAMLALTAETGDVAVRTDVNKSFILKGSDPAVLANWQELLTPTSAVTSVFGRNGAVTAQNGDYTTALVTETTNKRYQTDIQQAYNDATSSIQSQLNGKVNLSGSETINGVKTFSNMPILGAASGANGQIVYADASKQLKTITNFKYNDATGVLTTQLGNLGSNAYTSTVYQPLLTNPVVASTFTANYIPKFTGSGTTIGESQIFDDGSFVGIGVSSGLNRTLQIVGSTQISHKNTFSPNEMLIGQFDGSGNAAINNVANANLYFHTNNQRVMTLLANKNVGIDVNTPTEKLQVNGNIKLSSSNSFLYGGDNSGRLIVTNNDVTTYFGIYGSSHPTAPNTFSLVANNIPAITIPNNGRVGIGEGSPSEKLTIASGNIKLNSFQSSPNDYRYIGTEYSTGNGNNKAEIRFAIDGGDTFTRLQFHTANGAGTINERMRITSVGDVLVNSTSNTLGGKLASTLDDNGYSISALKQGTFGAAILARVDNTNSDFCRFWYSSSNTQVGSISTNGTTTSYNIMSDYRLKKDFKPFKGLDLLSKIKVYDYQWKADNTRMKGVIAHELQEVVPYAVTGEKDGKEMQQVDYSKLVPILIQSIQELQKEIEILKNK
jgi:hypothetical protein